MNRQEKRQLWLASQKKEQSCKSKKETQLKAIEKHIFNHNLLTSNYREFSMNTAMKSWTLRNEIKNIQNQLSLLKALASDSEKDKTALAMEIIKKCQKLAKKVERVNENLEDWERQSLSREIREIYMPLKKYEAISNGTASIQEKRKANNTFIERMDKVFDIVKNKH